MANTRTYFKNNTTSQPTKLFNMTQKEKLETLTGEKFPQPTEQRIKRHQIENSPFWHIEEPQGHSLIMGKYKFNKTPFESAEELHDWMNKDQWNIILSMAICVVTDMLNNQNKQ